MNSSVTAFVNRSEARAYDAVQLRFSRFGVLLIVFIGGFLLFAGVGTWASLRPSPSYTTTAILLGGGLVLILAGASYWPRVTRVLASLQVSAEGVSLSREDGRTYGILWRRYTNNLLIVDGRAVPPENSIPSLRTIQFILSPVGIPVQGPVTREAVEAILSSARAAGLHVEGWVDERTTPGSEVDIRILQQRVPS